MLLQMQAGSTGSLPWCILDSFSFVSTEIISYEFITVVEIYKGGQLI